MSSSTEREPDAGADSGADPERRRFFRAFAAEAVEAAGAIAGALGTIQREAASARDELLGRDEVAGGVREAGPAGGAPRTPAGAGRAGRALPDDRWTRAGVAVGDPGDTFRSPYRWDEGRLLLVDQRRLPDELVEVPCRSGGEVAAAIRSMVIQGAPAIGQAAAYGLALAAVQARDTGAAGRDAMIRGTAGTLAEARPTPADVRWALDRMLGRYEAVGGPSASAEVVADALLAEADAIATEAMLAHAELARHGAALLPDTGDRALRVLTHGSTGPLAGGQVGTALGVLQRAHADGRSIHVWVAESRPSLAGMRLTAWELARAGVEHVVIADAAAGWLMTRGEVDAVIVGVERVAANGDVAATIGTYALAVLAARHRVPFIVCTPTSSIDLATADGAGIPMEDRPAAEVTTLRGVRLAPLESPALDPACDVTPAELVTALVTEEGVISAPFAAELGRAVAGARARRAPIA